MAQTHAHAIAAPWPPSSSAAQLLPPPGASYPPLGGLPFAPAQQPQPQHLLPPPPPVPQLKPARRGRPPKNSTAATRGTKRKATPSARARSDPTRASASGGLTDPQSAPIPVADVLTALAGAAALTASMLSAPTPQPPSAISEPGSPTDEQRNKPGRKPLNDVPATKRTAQNRASQRAFRERRQAHLAELEEKVKRYENERGTIATQLAILAQRVREETPRIHALEAALQARDNEIAQWRARCTDLSRALDALQAVVRPSVSQAPIRSPMSTGLDMPSGPPPAAAAAPPPNNHRSNSQVVPPWYSSPSELQRPERMSTSTTAAGHSGHEGMSPTSIPSSSAETLPSGPDPSNRMEMAAINMPSTLSGMGMGMADTLPPLGSLTGLLPPSNSGSPQAEEQPKDSQLQARPSQPHQPDDVDNQDDQGDYECGFCAGDKAFCICRADSPSTEVEFPPPPGELEAAPAPAPGPQTPVAPRLDEEDDSGCGGCTKGGDCACRGDGIIDFDAGGGSGSDGPSSPTKSNTAALRPEADSHSSTSQGKSMSLSLAPLAHTGDALPLRRRRPEMEKGKLWAVNPSSLIPSSAPVRPSLPSRQGSNSGSASTLHVRRTSTSRRTGPKLWVTSEPECSGDPRTCAACGTDPELAAFCEAINEEEDEEDHAEAETQQGDQPASGSGSASPTSQPQQQQYHQHQHQQHHQHQHQHQQPAHCPSLPLPRPSSSGRPPSPPNTDQAETSVPEAWRRIRSHPHFQEFTHESGSGGLHLLADVVAGRHAHSAAPSARTSPAPAPSTLAKVPPRSRDPSNGSDSAARRASGLFALATLTRSAVDEPWAHRARTTSGPSGRSESRRARSASNDVRMAEDEESSHKRRRLYVENDGIRNALALLDRGALSDPRRPSQALWSSEEPSPESKGSDD